MHAVECFGGESNLRWGLPKSHHSSIVGHSSLLCFHLLKNMFDFPLLVLKGMYHYWKYVSLSSGLKQMDLY